MNILGLHFGHDAGVSVIRDGRIAACVLRERHSRTKHAISLQFQNIETALEAAGIGFDQLDYCAITSTQSVELIIDDAERFGLSFDPHPKHVAPCPLVPMLKAANIDPATRLVETLMDNLYDPRMRESFHYANYGHSFPEHRNRKRSDFHRFGWMDAYAGSTLWRGSPLGQIASADFSTLLNGDSMRHGFHYPVTVTLAGRRVAGYFVAHHAAHAASNFYQSGFDSAAILTHDGFMNGQAELSGMFFWGEGEKIYPLTPHHLILGALYELTGVRLGLGAVGAPGKLMGLAAYGNPRFYDPLAAGNWYDLAKIGFDPDGWWNHCLRLAREMGYDLSPLADPKQMLAPINVDIAASTQKLLEEGMLASVEALHKVVSRTGRRTANLCLSGGVALNCPANSRIHRESRFTNLFVEPGCDDSGLAIGAALFLNHNVLGQPRPSRINGNGASPYLGVSIGEDRIKAALHDARDDVEFSPCDDAAGSAAQALADNRIIAWFEDRSEIGPRALGHRSILADPRHVANWTRVNRIKCREAWRPFAPAVLESEVEDWFRGAPKSSPYMLFTAFVRSNQLPAITHADGTARIQTVSPASGEFFRVVEGFFARTGVPVVLNTSFNGPGEPIIETPGEAIRFLVNSPLDALYMGGFRVVRKESAAEGAMSARRHEGRLRESRPGFPAMPADRAERNP